MGIYLGDVEQDVWLGDVEQDVWLGDVQQNESGVFDFGNALKFDGVNDFVSIPNINTVNTYTISTWFFINNFDGMILGSSEANTTYIYIKDSVNEIIIRPTGGNFIFPSINQGEWYHLFVVYDFAGSASSVWLNGVASSTNPSGVLAINNPLDILGSRLGTGLEFGGIVDEAAFWENIVGTEQNAIDLYNGGIGADAEDVIANATWHYHLDQSGSDTIAIDSSGNGNDGNLINFDYTTSPWVNHYSGIPTSINTNVANQTYSYQGNSVEAFIQIFFDNADSTTTGRTIDISGLTTNANTDSMINDLVNNRGFNIVT